MYCVHHIGTHTPKPSPLIHSWSILWCRWRKSIAARSTAELSFCIAEDSTNRIRISFVLLGFFSLCSLFDCPAFGCLYVVYVCVSMWKIEDNVWGSPCRRAIWISTNCIWNLDRKRYGVLHHFVAYIGSPEKCWGYSRNLLMWLIVTSWINRRRDFHDLFIKNLS